MNKNAEKLYRQLINIRGEYAQQIKAIEEMAELIQAISKQFDNKKDLNNLIEEIVDVKIMIEQLEVIFASEAARMNEIRAEKLERIKNITRGK